MRNRPDTTWLSEHDVETAFKAILEAEEKLERKTKLEVVKSMRLGVQRYGERKDFVPAIRLHSCKTQE